MPSQPELLSNDSTQFSPEEQARREVARSRLAELLKDPQFRAIEGFPIGSDEDILALSDPPYYTACPNPFLPEIIAGWQQDREELRRKLNLSDESYQREPFAADVSEGKNDPIYNAHSYHTKVPHKAIMRYILHYTDPGDIVFDGFCGTGMTGVAAQLCGDKKAVKELGYRVDDRGVIWDGDKAISRLGSRKAVLNDLSPAATFISYNYNTPVDAVAFEREARRILKDVEQECGWMYETWHPHCDDPKRVKARINYTVWSEVFICPNCGTEMAFWDVAVDLTHKKSLKNWTCINCGIRLSKQPAKGSDEVKAEPVLITIFDQVLNQIVIRKKQKAVLINYTVDKRKFEKSPDRDDLNLLQKIESSTIPYPFPAVPMLNIGEKWGDTWRAGVHAGITHSHHFYRQRSLFLLATIKHKINSVTNPRIQSALLFWWLSLVMGYTRQNKYAPTHFSMVNRYVTGMMHIATLTSEVSLDYAFLGKLKRLTGVFRNIKTKQNASLITTESASVFPFQEAFADYIFVDPPFGGNLMYSELNFLHEAWLKVTTEGKPEAIVSEVQGKGLSEYETLISNCFSEFYRLLKPGRWMTVEFHNSQNSVWNAIQTSLQKAGFVVADVRILDKQQQSYKQINTTSAVKQDLIISAYKPNGNLEDNFYLKAGTEDGVWEFIRYHLGKLPVINQHDGQLVVNAERQTFLLFDRMVAFHVQRGVLVPMSAPEFYAGLEQRFTRRDGMYFLPEQVAEYDRVVMDSDGVVQLSFLVMEEKTAIQWLRQQLDPSTGGEPQTHADLNPKFKLVLHQAKHEKAPELIEILEQNFLQDEDGNWYVPDHNKASDLEKVRQRSLIREFADYINGTGRLRQFRTEAVRAGFADAYKRQVYDTIVKVAGRLPEDVLREDPDLLMYYDSAMLRKK